MKKNSPKNRRFRFRAMYKGPAGLIPMRSKWEVAYAYYLDRNNIAWEYEPKRFFVGIGKWTGRSYIPDFYLTNEDRFIEVKGRLYEGAKRKMIAFRKLYPDIKLEMLQAGQLFNLGVIDMYGAAILKREK